MKISETIRDDGLRIISCRVPSKKVHIELIARVGSAYDPPEKQGFFHYFEHMAFKGTTTATAEELKSRMEPIMLGSNAMTADCYTAYFGEAVFTKCEPLIKILAEIFFHSTYPQEEVEREKEVILNEIALNLDDDYAVCSQKLGELLWQRNPLRNTGVGTPEGVRQINREDLLHMRDCWYVPANTVLLAIGDITHDTLCKLAEQEITLNTRKVTHCQWGDEYWEPLPTKKTLLTRPGREKAQILFGCKFPQQRGEKTDIVIECLEKLLFRGMASRFWQEIREKRGLAYTVSGGVHDIPPLGSYLACSVETLPHRIETITQMVPELLATPLQDAAALERAKENLMDRATLGYDGNLYRLAYLIRQEILQQSPLKKLERFFPRQKRLIAAVTIDDIEQLRQEQIKWENFATVVLKPE